MTKKKINAVLGPTNTGKTHLAVETMLGFENGIIGSFSGSSGIPGDSGFQVQINLFGTEGTLLLYVEWGPSSKPRFEILRYDGKHQKYRKNCETALTPGIPSIPGIPGL